MGFITAFILFLAGTTLGQTEQYDFGQYAELVEAAAAEAERDELLVRQEYAVLMDFEAIEWLDCFMQTTTFAEMDQGGRELVFRDRHRLEFNASTMLIAIGRCGEARDRVRRLLDSGIDDSELRPRLLGTYDEAVDCAARAETAILASEYVAPENEKPSWYEWTLWGTGAAAVGTAIGYGVWARGRQDDLDSLIESGAIIVDPEREEQVIDDLQAVAIVAGSIGAACVTAGLLSYFLREKNVEAPVEASMTWGADGPIFVISGHLW